MIREAAFAEEHKIGEAIPLLDGRYRIVRRIPRDEWWANVQFKRRVAKQRGEPRSRAGFLKIDDAGREPIEFTPNWNEPGPEFQFCYELEKITP